MVEKLDVITEESIKLLVNSFYDKVKCDPDLSFIFMGAIGEDEADWQPHLNKMYDFWSSVLLTTGRYHGTPMQKHVALPSFDLALFDQWLHLFSLTTTEIHTSDAAAYCQNKASNIANSLKLAISTNREVMKNDKTCYAT